MKKIWLAAIAGWLLLPTYALAHVKWFVNPVGVNSPTVEPIWFPLTHPAVLIWLALTVLGLVVFWLLDKKLKAPQKLIDFTQRNSLTINYIAQAVLGVFLISSSLLPYTIVGAPPEFAFSETFGIAWQYLQIAIGALLIFNYKPKLASLALGILAILLLFTHGFVTFAENLIVLALAVYFYLLHEPINGRWAKYKVYGMEIIRIGAGTSLLVLALSEKLLNPTLSLAFLEKYHWNFMQSWLPWFNNELFVLSAGFSELIFGLVVILGLVTRLGTVLLSAFFILSAAAMMLQFGIWEEHSAVYSAVILLLAFGHGTRFWEKFTNGKVAHPTSQI